MPADLPAVEQFHWLTPERWPDLEQLFGPRGACDGCWCMYWKLRGKAFSEGCAAREGETPNRLALQALVAGGQEPGILAYNSAGTPVGWLALAPRESYLRLAHSPTLAPVDDTPVWSITCFFVEKKQRKQGLTLALLQAAIRMAAQKGARVLEGYPVEPQNGKMRDAFAFVGIASTFLTAGFREVARRSPTRPIMRLTLPE